MTLPVQDFLELIEHNCQLLDELCQAVSIQSDQLLNHADSQHTQNSIANHIRHICEHYTCLFSGISAWQSASENTLHPALLIDYDNRPRNSQAFANTTVAAHSIATLITQLRELAGFTTLCDAKVTVKSSTSTQTPAIAAPSTIIRELQFLHGHGIHHLAIIALLLKQIGIEMPRNFGTAASTLKYESQQ